MLDVYTPWVPPKPQDIAKMLHGLQDVSNEAASQLIKTHNAAMDLFFMFSPIAEINMGTALPSVRVPASMAPFIQPIQDKILRFLP